MKLFSILLLILLAYPNVYAAKFKYKFNDTPVAKALVQLVRQYPEAKITFLYNDLDTYTTSASIDTDNLKEAVKAITALNPITVREKKGHIFVEALQKGKYRYSGRLLNEYKEPVAHATVLLLNPKDSVVITYGITKKNGAFVIPCDKNPVIAKISSTGYTTRFFNFSGPDLGTITLNTNTISLDGITVMSGDVSLQSDRTIYVPLQRQKNTSMSGIELIEQLGIPQLHLTPNGSLETVDGKSVAIFIDFLPASNDDLTGMNLQDVRRVEFLEAPADPRFKGEKYVVNFIMDKYEYGGYMKLYGNKSVVMNHQDLQANARFQYKKMTYDLMGYALSNTNYHDGTATTEIYRFPEASGEYKIIDRVSSNIASKKRMDNYRTSFKATFSSDNVTAQSILSGGIINKPDNKEEGATEYSHDTYPDSYFISTADNHEKFITFNGSYYFRLPKKVSMTFSPTYTYSHTSLNSSYAEEGFPDILNNATDNTNKLRGQLTFNRNFGKKGSLSAYLRGQYDHYRTHYTGSATNYDVAKDHICSASLFYNIDTQKFYGEAEFGWNWYDNRFNEYISKTSTPFGSLYLFYLINDRHRFRGDFSYSAWAPNISFKSEALIKANHLMSYTGNSRLVPSPHYSLEVSYYWVPSNIGFLYLYSNIWNVNKRYVYEYVPDKEQMVRYIRQPMGEYRLIRYGLSGRLSLLNRNLRLNGSISNYIARNGAPYGYTLFSLIYSLSATYYLNDFYFMGKFANSAKYSDGFMVGDIYEDKSNYGITVGWANKHWNVRLSADNFARWNWNSHRQWFKSEYYDMSTDYYDVRRHANFLISVTYNFRYGKKIKDDNDLNTRNENSSGILKK